MVYPDVDTAVDDRAGVVDRLERSIATAIDDRTGISIGLIGSAGIGKSHLVRSVLENRVGSAPAGGPGAPPILRAAGDERRRNEPFAVLEQLTGPTPDGEDPADVTFDRIDDRCASGPLVVWVDDAHHADAASLAGLRRLVWASRSLPLAVIISARPYPVPEQLDMLLRQVDATLQLPAMDRMMAERLVFDRTGRWPGPRLRAALDAAGGNPLFIGELLRELQEAGRLAPVGGDLVDTTADMPSRGSALDSLIRGHLAELDAAATELLGALAVWGTEVTLPDLAELLYSSPDALDPALRRAVRSGVVAASSEKVDATVDFAHDLYREVTYAALPDRLRRSTHRRVAAVLGQRGGAPALVAEHLLQARTSTDTGGDTELLAALQAAVNESEQYAPQVAIDLLEVAEGLTDPNDANAESLLLQRAGELFQTGRGAAAERLVLDRIGGVRDPAVAAGLQRILITSQINRADVDGALVSIGRTLSIPRLPEPVRRGLEGQRQWLLLLGARFGELGDLDAMLAQARAAGDSAAMATLLNTQAVLWHTLGDARRAREIFERRPESADLDDSALGRNTSMVWPAMFALDIDGPVGARPAIDRAREEAARINSQWVYPFIGFVGAGAAWGAGDWDGAVAEGDAALEAAEETGTGWISIPVGMRVDIDARRGQVRAARKRLERYRSRRLPDQFGRGDVDLAEISLLEAEGSIEAAAGLAEIYWARVRTMPGMGGVEYAIDVVRMGLIGLRPGLVEQVIEDLVALPPSQVRPGIVDLVVGAARSDPDTVERAVRAFTESGLATRVAHAQEELACAAAAQGDRKRAVAAMEAAVAAYERVRATVDRDRLLARLRAHGIRRGSRQAHRSSTSGWDSLTATERRITDLICEGLTNREIGARLFISPRTVQSHVSHVLEKTGLRSRVEVAAAAPR